MIGKAVEMYGMNDRMFNAVMDLRNACDKIEGIVAFLSYNPRIGSEPDPLNTMFNWTPGESQVVREIFEELEVRRLALIPFLNGPCRQLTGLE